MSRQRRESKKQRPGRDAARRKGRREGVPLYVWIGLAVVAVAVVALVLTRPQQAAAEEITAGQAYQKYEAGAYFLDVRTQAEYGREHIAKSTLIPLDELPNKLSGVPRDRDVVVVCRSGTRSKEGAAILRQAGYTRVSCLSGGIRAWMAAGYPVEP